MPLMQIHAQLRSRAAHRAVRHSGIETLEARIAPATLAALPGNSSFEDSVDFSKWTVNAGPVDSILDYVSETTVVRDPLAPEGVAYARLSFAGRVASTATGFGPSIQSETFTATAGEEISVVWRATDNGDVAHPRGRLFTAAGAPVATIFDADTGTTAFDTDSVIVPSAGEYYLLFEAGSSDLTIGGIIGATLEIDAIHRSPSPVAVTTLGNGQLSVVVSGDSATSNAFLVTLDDTAVFAKIFVNGSLDFTQPLASIDRITFTGLAGSDELTVNSSNGLIALAEGIHFDGAGGTDTLKLVQSGGAARSSHVFSVGPNVGEGTSTISHGATVQTVQFQNLEPVLDNVPAASLTINATAATNTISSIVGLGGGIFTGATAKVTVDNFESIEFNNKTALTIKGLGGSDTFNLNNPTAPAGLASIAVQSGDASVPPGARLNYLTAGSIQASAVGTGTITATGLPTVAFTGIEVAAVAGVTVTPGTAGLDIIATGDQNTTGQSDTFAITTDVPGHFLTLSLNGTISLYAHLDAISSIAVAGLGGTDTISLTGTSAAEIFTYDPTATDAGTIGISGVVSVQYSEVESIVLNAMGGDDTFMMNGNLGKVQAIGGAGSDTIDFSGAPSRVVFDLDAIGIDQFINSNGQIVNLGDVIENFVGTPFNDTLYVNATIFPRNLDGGSNANQTFPPGDELFFDAQSQVVNTTLVDVNTGTFFTVGYADVTFDEFETRTIGNSPSGAGFGTPDNSNAFHTAHVYNLLLATSGGKKAPGKKPTAVATADFNGDGFMDFVTVNSATSNVSVFLNLGDGTFGAPVSYKTRGLNPMDIAIGNFDANPGLDLAVVNSGSSTLAILSGDNHGGFGTAALKKVASSPRAIAVGHLDGDTIDDLVIAHSVNKISVILGTGSGLGSPSLFSVRGKRPTAVVIADFSGDGKADIATANFNSNNVSLFQGDGLGGFATAERFAAGTKPRSLAVADFDLDGKLDLAVTNRGSTFISVLLGNGATAPALQFQPQLSVALPGIQLPNSIVAADFNGDGIADLGLSSRLGARFTVLLGGNTTTFTQPFQFNLGEVSGLPNPGAIAVADFNHDGLLDVVMTGYSTADARVLPQKI